MVSVMAAELCARASGLDGLQYLAWAAMALVIVVAIPAFGLREVYLIALCAVLSALILVLPGFDPGILGLALDQASFLMAFILLLGLLYEAAESSPSVAKLGQYLTRQPPGRRYYALYGGTGLLAVLFNVGVVSFLVPLIQRGITTATPGDPLNPVRERRQVSAMLRGFAWAMIWSPTAMAPLALLELIDGINRNRWMLAGFSIFLALMVLGAIEDRLRFAAYRGKGIRQHVAFPQRAALFFVAACAWLFGLSYLAAYLTDDTLVFGLLLSCPVMVAGWLTVQARGGGVAMPTRLRQIVRQSLPASAPIAVTLATSGFVGRAAAGLIPAQQVADALGLASMPDYMLLTAIPVVVAVLSLLALSPIMMAVFFGALFGALPVLPADPTLLALSISCGWGLSMTFSPFATVVLLAARTGNFSPVRLTWGWNLTFTLAVIPLLLLAFGMLTGWH